MPWTDSSSRDEWLAEVRRRGERIRRRRRFLIAALAVFALVLPMSAVAGFLSAVPDHNVELTAAGRAPAAQRPPEPATDTDTVTEADVVEATATSGAGDLVARLAPEPRATELASPTPTTTPTTTPATSPATSVVVPRRLPASTDDVSPEPRPPASVAPADDPVVRAPTTTMPPTRNDGPTSSAISSARSAAVGPVDSEPALTACPAAEVRVTVVTDKAVYAPGEVVSGSSTLENRSSTTCLVPTRAFFRVEDAAGKVVGSFAYTMEFRNPVKAEPGKTFISGFSWDQNDCSWSTCAQVPAGTYVAVADWTESGPYVGRVSFQVSA